MRGDAFAPAPWPDLQTECSASCRLEFLVLPIVAGSLPANRADSMNDWMRTLADHYTAARRRWPMDELVIVFDIDGTILDMRRAARVGANLAKTRLLRGAR
jgi:hypothetical protein